MFGFGLRKRLVIAGMATMPSRGQTMATVLRSIVPQVDRLYLYLDGHSEVPAAAQGEPRIVSVLSRDRPGLHGNGKFLPLSLESASFDFVGVDDDIAYPSDYVASLRAGRRKQPKGAVVGYHGMIFARPMVGYRQGRKVFHFKKGLDAPRVVDALGTGTVMFSTGHLRFDVDTWPYVNCADICLALEAAKAKVPLICLKRDAAFLRSLEGNQPDSCYSALKRDDSRHTLLAQHLIAMDGGRS